MFALSSVTRVFFKITGPAKSLNILIRFTGCLIMLMLDLAANEQKPGMILKDQFALVDSVLSYLSAQPELIQGNDECKTLLDNLTKEFPVFSGLFYIDKHGKIAYQSVNRNEPQEELAAFKKTLYYRKVKSTKKAYYSELCQVRGRFCFVLSKPIIISQNIFGTKLGGVLIAYVNIADCLQSFGAQYNKPFEVIHDEKPFYAYKWRNPSQYNQESVALYQNTEFILKYASDSIPQMTVDSSFLHLLPPSQEFNLTSAITNNELIQRLHSRAAHINSAQKRWIGKMPLLSGIILVLVGVLLYVREKKKKMAMSGEKIEREESVKKFFAALRDRILSFAASTAHQEADNRSIVYEEARNRIVEQEKAQIEATVRDEIAKEIRESLTRQIREAFDKTERPAIEAQIKKEITENIKINIRKDSMGQLEKEAHDSILNEIRSEIRKSYGPDIYKRYVDEVTEEIRQEILTKEIGLIRQNVLSSFRDSIKAEISPEMQEKVINEIRAELQIELKRNIDQQMLDNLRAQELENLRSELRDRLRERESEKIIAEEHELLTSEISQAIRQKYYNHIEHQIKDSLQKEISETVRLNEYQTMLQTERQRVQDEIAYYVEQNERQLILDQARSEVYGKEIEVIRSTVAEEIRQQEMASLTLQLRNELAVELTPVIRSELSNAFEERLQRQIEAEKKDIARNIKAESEAYLHKRVLNLQSIVSQLNAQLTAVSVRDSLAATATMMSQEQEKHRYYSLNATDTKSLVEYLSRLTNQFDQFLEGTRASAITIADVVAGLGPEEMAS